MNARLAYALELVVTWALCAALVSGLWCFARWLDDPPAMRLFWCVLLVARWSTNPKITFLQRDPPARRDQNLTG